MYRLLIVFLGVTCAGCSPDTFVPPDDGGSDALLDSYVVGLDAGDGDSQGDSPGEAADASPDKDVAETGPSFKRVFISSTTTESNFGSLAAADAVCGARAVAAGLGGTWKAWLSTSTTSAASRLTHASVPYQLVDGTIVASNWFSLVSGTIKNPIGLDETGTSKPGSGAWTGTNADGSSYNGFTCQDWTVVEDCASSMTYHGLLGVDGHVDSTWTNWGGDSCCTGAAFPFYCFEQ
jgi:hypothetical protein